MIPRTFRVPMLLVGALMAQAAIVPHFAIAGRVVDVMLLLAVCAGLVGGPDRGAVIGFLAGAGTDLVVQTPFGMWALVGAVIGWGVGSIYGSYIIGGRAMRYLTIAMALATGTAMYVVLGRLIGQTFLGDVSLFPVIITVALGGLALSPLALRATAWAFGETRLPWDHQ